ncbi:hypothetical protein SBA4_3950026 [Candidatus Sulfopaludibacter sp. SbA4]|nr:hypothetical protein SBA4_3950026 [Candidatus Sulfopaludibacter sp. SbA4]
MSYFYAYSGSTRGTCPAPAFPGEHKKVGATAGKGLRINAAFRANDCGYPPSGEAGTSEHPADRWWLQVLLWQPRRQSTNEAS